MKFSKFVAVGVGLAVTAVSLARPMPVAAANAKTEKIGAAVLAAGALYSLVPGKRLEEIGILSIRTRELISADGRHDKRQMGEARLTIDQLGETLTCPVIFGPDDSLNLLGATALEIFGCRSDYEDSQTNRRHNRRIFGFAGVSDPLLSD